jgi:lambda family phage minor tail protein L
MTIQAEIQKLATAEMVELFILDLSPLGEAVTYRFCSGTVNRAPISYGGQVYTPMPIEAAGFEYSGTGPLPSPALRLADETGLIQASMRARNDWRGATVTRILTFKKYLDGQPEAGGGEFPREIYTLDRKSRQEGRVIEWGLESVLNQQGRKLPRRLILKDYCEYIYRTWSGSAFVYAPGINTCPYQGTAYFTKLGGVATAATDVCGKKFSDCKLRHPHPHAVPFRGFPGVHSVRRG